jgi:hypothetical protein
MDDPLLGFPAPEGNAVLYGQPERPRPRPAPYVEFGPQAGVAYEDNLRDQIREAVERELRGQAQGIGACGGFGAVAGQAAGADVMLV